MEWIKVVARRNSPLFTFFICSGITSKYTVRVLGRDFGFKNYLFIDNESFVAKESSPDVSEKLLAAISEKGEEVLEEFYYIWLKKMDELLEAAYVLSADKSVDKKVLARKFDDFREKNYELSTSLMFPINIEKYLESRLRQILINKTEKENVDSYILKITFSEKNDDAVKEQISLGKLSSLIRSGTFESLTKKELSLLDKHICEFGWLNTGRFFRDSYTRKEIYDRVKQVSRINFPPHKELKIEFDSKEKKIISIAKKYVFLRTQRMLVFMKASFIAKPFLSKIAQALGLKFEDLIYLSPEEIYLALHGMEIDSGVIPERKKGFAYYIKQSTPLIFSGEEKDNFKKENFSLDESFSLAEIKGISAYKGVISGVVRIVKTRHDILGFKKGEVLVAPMTIPDFVPAMEKAAAFVTDEGGMLCHAAIVARELKKPCVIGTRNATKVLQDGDLVLVDANKGIVKKI